MHKFWNKVDIREKHECWEFKNSKLPRPTTSFKGTNHSVGRIAYQLASPSENITGLDIRHHCDNPRCCNPHHLTPGTRRENMQDMYQRGRGRQPKGVECGRAKLTEEDVRNIRLDTRTQQAIADEYGVSQVTISQIKLRKSWSHIK